MSEKVTESVADNKKWVKICVALFVALFVFIIIAVSSSPYKYTAFQKCKAMTWFDYENDSEEYKNKASNDCDNELLRVYNDDQSKFAESVDSRYSTYTNEENKGKESAGHKLDWYLEQVK